MKFEKWIFELEKDVREGNLQQVAQALGKLNCAQVPRPHRLKLANIARRTGCLNIALRLLEPIMFTEDKRNDDATAQEAAEYGVTLQRSGATEEAIHLLSTNDMNQAPESWLYLAFCHFSQWDYVAGLAAITEYLLSDMSDYARCVGLLNRAAALVYLKNTEAAPALAELENMTAGNDYWRLRANTLELKAQLFIQHHDFKSATQSLSVAQELLSKNNNHDQLWIKKWQAVITANELASPAPLIEFRTEAVARRHWESVRDVDFQILKINFDKEIYRHLLFGTPFEAYRRRMENELGVHKMADKLVLGTGERTLDLENGVFEGSYGAVKMTKNMHALFACLIQDFYRPANSGQIFSRVFEGEHYSVFSSPGRIHQTIFRARAWLAENHVPARIEEDKNTYRLIAQEGLQLKVPFRRDLTGPHHSLLSQLSRVAHRASTFRAREVREELGVSPARFNRFLSWAVEEGYVTKLGAGPGTYYRLKVVNSI